jgi:hypothetical protein
MTYEQLVQMRKDGKTLPKYIVMVSDGYFNVNNGPDAVTSKNLQEFISFCQDPDGNPETKDQIKFYVVGIGKEYDKPVTIDKNDKIAPFDEKDHEEQKKALKIMATKTGGDLITANGDVQGAFDKIENIITSDVTINDASTEYSSATVTLKEKSTGNYIKVEVKLKK